MNFNTFSTLYGATIATSSFSGSGYTSSLVQAAQDLDFTITIISGSSLGDELQITSSFGSLITHSLTTSSFNERTSSVALTDGSIFQNVLVQGTVQAANATTAVVFASPISGAVSMNVVTVVPTGSYSVGPVSGSLSSSNYYLDTPNNPIGLLQYAINNVEEGSSNPTGSLCLRLPAPSTGQTVIVNNNTSRNLRIFCSSSAGRFTQGQNNQESSVVSGSAFILPPGPNSATFECVQNPTQGVWNITFPPGTTTTLVNEFHVVHTQGTASVGTFALTPPPNSNGPLDNFFKDVLVFPDMDNQSGQNPVGYAMWADKSESDLSGEFSNRAFDFFWGGGAGAPDIYPGNASNTQDGYLYYHSPTEVKDANDFITRFTSPYTYIERIQCHTNVHNEDYFSRPPDVFPPIPGMTQNPEGGLKMSGRSTFLFRAPSDPPNQVTQAQYGVKPFPFPDQWLRRPHWDVNIQTYVDNGWLGPLTAFELERRSANLDPNDPSSQNRVVPSDLPTPNAYDAANPEIGQIHTEYFDSNEDPQQFLLTNPLPVGGFNGRTIPYNRINTNPPAGPFVDDVNSPHSPLNVMWLRIPTYFKSKTYKFRIETTIRVA